MGTGEGEIMSQEHSMATDVISIQNVLFKSLRAADEQDWDSQAALYNDEITIDFGGVQPTKTTTPVELASWSAKTYALVKTMHMQASVEVIVEGDRATSHSYGHARHERTDNHDFWHIYAQYENDFIRMANGWKISRIKMTPVFQEGNPKLLEESATANEG
jgi:hypothetical protein